MAHLRNIDLNLIVILECLFRHLNVSSASQELGLTQSAVSHSLVKLRNHYKDPLFVRISKGVQPTKFAKSIRAEVEEFVKRAIHLTDKQDHFNPTHEKGRIVIATTDYFEVVVGPKLLERVSKEAPHLQLSFRPTFGSLPKDSLEDGVFDLAIAGFYKNLPEGFYQQKLFSDHFATAYRTNHPLLKKGLNSVDFFKLEHGLITLQGDFIDNLSKKKFRNIKYGTSSFTAIAWILADSNLVLTAPSLLLNRFKEFFPLTIEACPVENKPLELRMIWHGLTNQTPLKIWIRQIIKEISANLS